MKLEYFIVLLLCAAGPFVLSFSRKINFYKNPLKLLCSIAFPLVVFIAWDVIATQRGHWSFNNNYVTGLFIFNLPVEEILFFVVIPFCGLFSWEVVKYYTRKEK